MTDQVGLDKAIALVRQELSKRQQKNPRYSLRGFALSMGLSHSVLSLFLSRRRMLSLSSAQRIAEEIGLTAAEADQFVQVVTRQPESSKSDQEDLNR